MIIDKTLFNKSLFLLGDGVKCFNFRKVNFAYKKHRAEQNSLWKTRMTATSNQKQYNSFFVVGYVGYVGSSFSKDQIEVGIL